MCEIPSWRLKLWALPPHPTSTYTCEVTIVPRVCSGKIEKFSTNNKLTYPIYAVHI